MRVISLTLVFVAYAICFSACGNRNDSNLNLNQIDLSLALSNSGVEERLNSLGTTELFNTDFQTVRRVERPLREDAPLALISAEDLVVLSEKAAHDLNPETQLQLLHLRRGKLFTYATFKQLYKEREIVGSRLILRMNGSGNWTSATSTLVEPSLLQNIEKSNSENIKTNRYFSELYKIISEKSVILPKKDTDEIMKFYAAREIIFESPDSRKFYAWFNETNGDLLSALDPDTKLEDFTTIGTVLPSNDGEAPIVVSFPFVRAIFTAETPVFSTEDGRLNLQKLKGSPVNISLQNDFLTVYKNSDISRKIGSNYNISIDNPQVEAPSALFSLRDLTDTAQVNIDQGFSLQERNVFYWIMHARNYFKNVLAYEGANFKLIAKTDSLEDKDDAHFNQLDRTITFGTGDKFLKNTAFSRSIITHEYFHSITREIYGVVVNYEFSTIDEALSDYFSGTILNDPHIAKGALKEDTGLQYLRNMQNNMKYPNHFSGRSFHRDSQIFSGALWDLRSQIGKEEADLMIHEASLAQPRTIKEFLMELLVLDESKDDNNPFTPSKNKQAIVQAFFNHGLNSSVEFSEKFNDKKQETALYQQDIALVKETTAE